MTDLRDAEPTARRGRPPSTSRRELQLIALQLFTERGFENTTIEQIAAEASISERTFFRYFTSKASVLWTEFETEVETIRAALAAVPDDMPMMNAIRGAVVAANHYRAEDVPEVRLRMNLIATVPALSFSAAEHYESWEQAIREFVGRRLGQPADSLYPLAVGRATLAVCRAAYDRWSARADNNLTVYLDAALTALACGFASETMRTGVQQLARTEVPGRLQERMGCGLPVRPCPGIGPLRQVGRLSWDADPISDPTEMAPERHLIGVHHRCGQYQPVGAGGQRPHGTLDAPQIALVVGFAPEVMRAVFWRQVTSRRSMRQEFSGKIPS